MTRDKWGLVVLVLGGLALATAVFSDDLDGEPIAEIRIDGLEHTKRYVVERELRSHVGEPFSQKTLGEDAERLDRLRRDNYTQGSSSEGGMGQDERPRASRYL